MSEKEKPAVDPSVEGLKVKKKKPGRPRKLIKDTAPVKLDLTKKEEKPVETAKVEETVTEEPVKEAIEMNKDIPVESKEEVKAEENTIQEIEKTETPVKEAVIAERNPLPENVNKLVSFMNETGGNLEDYVRLNRDYSNVNEEVLLKEYYKNTKPHLDDDEINFVLEDKFYFDDEVEDERTVKKKQLARKEEIAKAKSFLEETKKKYYDEIKLRPGVTQEQQKAMEFFNRYNKEQEQVKSISDNFKKKSSEFFNPSEFKGFEFDLGDKRFRYGVNDVENVAKDQASINTFLGKFLDENGTMSEVKDYHKALYMASNADDVAKHFYDQGKADATKDIMAKSKNINTDPKPNGGGDVFVNGFKVRAITGADSSKLKIQRKLKK